MRLVDRVAYINHDIDDALRAGIISSGDLPAEEIELLGPTGARRIDALVADIVSSSREAGDIVQSDEVGGAMLRLRKFMFDRVYLGDGGALASTSGCSGRCGCSSTTTSTTRPRCRRGCRATTTCSGRPTGSRG